MPQPDDRLTQRTVYCTVVAQNYLPQALALYSSIREVEPDRTLVVLVVDGERSELESGRQGLRMLSTRDLDLSERAVLELATIYDVVEFSTSFKPVLIRALLDEFEQVVYLDPDTFLISPLIELEALLDASGVVLTPHFLLPIPPGSAHISEVHNLTVGIHNLGFIAAGRGGLPFLAWWWSHLERECLNYPLLGMFVDQKWTDVGATLFNAHSIIHAGYNVGPWNLHERTLERSGGVTRIRQGGDELRFVHFSGFDPTDPDAISERLTVSMRGLGLANDEFSRLSHRYAEVLLASRAVLGGPVPYAFSRDARGGKISKRVRLAYRKDLLDQDRPLPLAFLPEEVQAFRKWRRRSLGSRIAMTLSDSAIAAKYVFPDQYAFVRRRMSAPFSVLRRRLLGASRVRR